VNNNPTTTEALKAILLAELIKIIRIIEGLATSRKFWALVASLTTVWNNQHSGAITVEAATWLTVTALGAYAAATGLENIGDTKPVTTITETTKTTPSAGTTTTVAVESVTPTPASKS